MFDSVSPTPPTGPSQGPGGQQSPSAPQGGQPPNIAAPVPAGLEVWIKFLSFGGHQATVKEAELFTQQLMRTIGSQIEHEKERSIEAIRKLRGEDDDE